jgi:NitT/TauT family transport system ATP-binding protein
MTNAAVAGGLSGLPATDTAVSFENVGIRFGGTQNNWVLRNLDLTIKRGEFFVLVGPSGCGKSTLLRILAGISKPTEGRALIGAEEVTGPGSDRGMVFQSVDVPLMDWLTARQNVEFGLRMQGRPRADIRSVANEFLTRVGLQRAADKFPRQLSGGMKQRVQIARILATQPEIILMDEPFAALDAQTRRLLQQEVVSLWEAEKKTFVYVTHDIREAALLGQRIAVMSAPPDSGIKRIHEVDLPYPRDDFDSRFSAIARAIETDIQEEVAKSWDA